MANRPKGISRKQEQLAALKAKHGKAEPKALSASEERHATQLRRLLKTEAAKDAVTDAVRDGLGFSHLEGRIELALQFLDEQLEAGDLAASQWAKAQKALIAAAADITEKKAYIRHVEVPSEIRTTVFFPGLDHLASKDAPRLGKGDDLPVG